MKDTEELVGIRSPRRKKARGPVRWVDHNFMVTLAERLFAPLPTEEPFDWCVAHLVFDDTEVKGPFNPAGREYLRDIINANGNHDVRQQTLICAVGLAKTLTNIAGMAWKFAHRPMRNLSIFPAVKGAGGSQNFVTSRFIPCLKASPAIAELMPSIQERFFMNGSKVRINGSHCDFTGANSPAQLGSNRCSDVRAEECDKYKGKLGDEAGTDALIGKRTEGVEDFQIFRYTTPTVEARTGWKNLSRGDFRQRHLPCPHCNSEYRHRDLLKNGSISESNLKGWLRQAWSEQYCVLPTRFEQPGANNLIIPTGYVVWDKEATRRDGGIDRQRAYQSARIQCPHCGGHIRDEHKLWQDKNGVWIPTKAGSEGHESYQLSALYAPVINRESRYEGRVEKFLDAQEDGEGMKDFINSTLAEVDVSQEHAVIELSSQTNFATEDWIPLMDCDFQKNWPIIWFVVQKWSIFKLHPPFPISNGKPAFAQYLEKNPVLKAQCEKIVGAAEAAWMPLGEIMRFDPRTGQFPMLDFIIAQNLTGEKLIHLWREQCGLNTLDLGRWLYREMGSRLPKGGDAEVIAAGHVESSGDDAWAELRELQQQFKVGEALGRFGLSPNRALLVDSGYAEENNPEVLRKCFESGTGPNAQWEYYDPLTKKFIPFKVHAFCRPVPKNCWTPYKGYPMRKRWKIAGIEQAAHFAPGDPFSGLGEKDKYAVAILEAASEHYFRKWIEKRNRQKEIREAILGGRSYRGNLWNIAADCQYFGQQCKRREDFESQLNSKGINQEGEIWERGTGGGGKRRYPDHLLDCASQMQEAHAETLGFFSYEPVAPAANKTGGQVEGRQN